MMASNDGTWQLRLHLKNVRVIPLLPASDQEASCFHLDKLHPFWKNNQQLLRGLSPSMQQVQGPVYGVGGAREARWGDHVCVTGFHLMNESEQRRMTDEHSLD